MAVVSGAVRVVVHLAAEFLARSEDVRLGDGNFARAALGEEIATEQRAGQQFHDQSALPGVRQMRRVVPADFMLAELQDLTVRQCCAGRSATSSTDTMAATRLHTGTASAPLRGNR